MYSIITKAAEAVARTIGEGCATALQRQGNGDLEEFSNVLSDSLKTAFRHIELEGFVDTVKVEDDANGDLHVHCVLFAPIKRMRVTFEVAPQDPA